MKSIGWRGSDWYDSDTKLGFFEALACLLFGVVFGPILLISYYIDKMRGIEEHEG